MQFFTAFTVTIVLGSGCAFDCRLCLHFLHHSGCCWVFCSMWFACSGLMLTSSCCPGVLCLRSFAARFLHICLFYTSAIIYYKDIPMIGGWECRSLLVILVVGDAGCFSHRRILVINLWGRYGPTASSGSVIDDFMRWAWWIRTFAPSPWSPAPVHSVSSGWRNRVNPKGQGDSSFRMSANPMVKLA